MKMDKFIKESFTVIGKQGSTNDESDFIQKIWEDAEGHFEQIEHLVKKDDTGTLCGLWGAMSDFTLSFKPWENNFDEGLYLAGFECTDGAQPPAGWDKWVVPGYEYLRVEREHYPIFAITIKYIRENNIPLVGAVHDFTCPKTRRKYMCFPIKTL